MLDFSGVRRVLCYRASSNFNTRNNEETMHFTTALEKAGTARYILFKGRKYRYVIRRKSAVLKHSDSHYSGFNIWWPHEDEHDLDCWAVGDIIKSPSKRRRITPKQKIICDICGLNWNGGDKSGGFLLGTQLICPDCSDRMMSVLEPDDRHAIDACPSGISFTDWVLSML